MVIVKRQAAPRIADQTTAWPSANTTWLLDVNVLLALLDPVHPHHHAAHDWFIDARRSWATCAITENGAMRIMSHPRYGNRVDTTAHAAELLADLCAHDGHRFWADELSLLSSTQVDRSRLLAAEQVTDTWLLALAAQHGGRLATFDKRLVTDAVQNGAAVRYVIPA